ncbi:universal stress protein [Flavihumibacter sp. R14]|nr:universal stress protein [Flavihumibacter soli]
MKKIIAAFDGLKFSASTQQHALDIAPHDSLLVGVFLDDFTHHSFKLTDMVGDEGVSAEKIKQLVDKDVLTRKESVAAFENGCQQAGIKYIVHHDKSIALQELVKETIYSDLLIIGSHESLTHTHEELPSTFIKDLLADVQCPVMLVPSTYSKIENVVILYDSDPSSVYAAKMMSYMLPELKSLPVEILSVHSEQAQNSFPHDELIREFMLCHFPDATFRLVSGIAEKEVVEYLADRQNTLVVLGAYRRSMVSRWLRPSLADALIRKTQLPLFTAHYK